MITVGAFLIFISGLLLGHALGQRRGRDAQWVDDFIDAGKRDRARRNRLGQFTTRKNP